MLRWDKSFHCGFSRVKEGDCCGFRGVLGLLCCAFLMSSVYRLSTTMQWIRSITYQLDGSLHVSIQRSYNSFGHWFSAWPLLLLLPLLLPLPGICPFNFPAMIPLWMFPLAVTAGNTFVMKPSEKCPGAAMLLASMAKEAGLPDGKNIELTRVDSDTVYFKELVVTHCHCLHHCSATYYVGNTRCIIMFVTTANRSVISII